MMYVSSKCVPHRDWDFQKHPWTQIIALNAVSNLQKQGLFTHPKLQQVPHRALEDGKERERKWETWESRQIRKLGLRNPSQKRECWRKAVTAQWDSSPDHPTEHRAHLYSWVGALFTHLPMICPSCSIPVRSSHLLSPPQKNHPWLPSPHAPSPSLVLKAVIPGSHSWILKY